ncbi:hypothetical protein J6590_003987 [Homalodisca vitripennis]|nr:hypothetical protein J6590_003987 [Homalodisca vitripennis]
MLSMLYKQYKGLKKKDDNNPEETIFATLDAARHSVVGRGGELRQDITLLLHSGHDVQALLQKMNSYLKIRRQVMKLGVVTSEAAIELFGVPQGSFLGPSLFNLHAADLPISVKNCKVHQYADDCQRHLEYKSEAMKAAVEIRSTSNL